jgi:hypothetical protein
MSQETFTVLTKSLKVLISTKKILNKKKKMTQLKKGLQLYWTGKTIHFSQI